VTREQHRKLVLEVVDFIVPMRTGSIMQKKNILFRELVRSRNHSSPCTGTPDREGHVKAVIEAVESATPLR